MTDEEHPDEQDPDDRDPGVEAGAGADDLPPPATWAGRARQDAGEGSADPGDPGLTEELDGIAEELDADLDEIEADDADEREEPPDEFEFAEDDVEDESDEELEETAAEASEEDEEAADPPPADSPSTTEADTLSLADREAAKEAAHAGLSARAGKAAGARRITTGTQAVAPVAAKAAVAGNGKAAGQPPKRRLWWRFAAASLVIVVSMATATSVAFLLFLSDFAQGLNDDKLNAARAQLAEVEGGGPQTILVLGSDKRSGTPGDPGRSDTALLLRVDPDKNFLSLMSLPRDLEVPIPGYGTDKLNAAYSYGEQAKGGGGPELAIKTIKEYLGIPINHVVNVDFEGFYEAVNAIDCVYIDVDQQYLNTNEGVAPAEYYAEIDVPAGYSKLCGYKALQYVRYRHNDNDLVRGARQQDFIREARQRIPPSELLPVFGGDELIDIFTKNTSSDINRVTTIIEMLKTFVEVRSAPVRQVSIGTITDDGGVSASKEQVKTAVNQFLGNDIDETSAEEIPEPAGKSQGEKKSKKPKPAPDAGLIDATGTGQQYAATFESFMAKKKARLPIFYPTKVVPSSSAGISPDSQAAAVAGPDNKRTFYMYKFVLPYQEAGFTSYYGVSGVNWRNPPILNNPSETRTIDGRDYLLFYERDKLRLVGWKTKRGSYWVINTLTRALSEDEMLGLATATSELDQ